MNDAYLQLTIEELTINEDFIQWVQSGLHDDTMQAWINDHPDQKSKIQEAQQIVNQLQFAPIEWNPIRKQNLWERIDQSTTTTKSSPGTNSLWRGLTVAATVMIASLAIWLWPSNDSSLIIQTSFAQNTKRTLPDNSTIWINENSLISVDTSSFHTNKRIVNLEGEAQFQVTKNMGTFEVITNKGKVTVLGTRFNVIDTAGVFSVSCYEGKVRVDYQNKQWILTAGKSMTWRDQSDEIDSSLVQIDGYASWIEQNKYFTSRKLSFVFDHIATQFNKTIIYDPVIKDRLYTGFISKVSLESSLNSVCWPLHLKYKIEGEKVIIIHEQ